jgi:hypothetical protein
MKSRFAAIVAICATPDGVRRHGAKVAGEQLEELLGRPMDDLLS